MKKRFITAGCLAGLILVLDQASKLLVRETMHLWEGREVVPGLFNLVFVLNKGAAFGFLNDHSTNWQTWFLIGASVVAIGVVAYMLTSKEAEDPFMYCGLGLIMGGALGNLVDRIFIGSVVDFLDFYVGSYHWPAFNVADIAITLGAFSLIFSFYRTRKHASHSS